MSLAAAAANITQQPSVADDPDEVDISKPYQGQPTARQGNASQTLPGANSSDPTLRLMQQMFGPDSNNSEAPNEPDTNDPLMQMMQQIMSGSEPKQQAQPSSQEYVWRIIHALFAFALALYVALSSTFDGSSESRWTSDADPRLNNAAAPRLFWTFATAESVLQSTRYFVEKGRLPENGFLGMVGSVLPEPFKGYVAIMARYGTIWTTVLSDALVIVFVFGALAWWKGQVML